MAPVSVMADSSDNDRAYSEPGSLAIIGPNGIATYVPEPGFSAIFGADARF
jgi:hypothetical protein